MKSRKFVYAIASASALTLTLGLFTNMYGFNSGTVAVKQLPARMDARYLGTSSTACLLSTYPIAFTESTIVLRFKIQDSPVRYRNYVASELGCRVVTKTDDGSSLADTSEFNPYFPIVLDTSCASDGEGTRLVPIGQRLNERSVGITCERSNAKLVTVLARHQGQRAFFKITHNWRELIEGGDGFESGP